MAGRRAIAELALDPRTRAMAKLAASELIVNALEYAGLRQGDVIELQATIDGECLRVSVCDPGPGPGHRLRTGLGLKTVERASDRWGVERGDELTCWWFELDLVAVPAPERTARFDAGRAGLVALGGGDSSVPAPRLTGAQRR